MTLRFALAWVTIAAFAASPAAHGAEPKKPPGAVSVTPAPNAALMAVWVADDTTVHDPKSVSSYAQGDCSHALNAFSTYIVLQSFKPFITGEKAYFQEKDIFGAFPLLAVVPGERPFTNCWKYTITLGHLGSAKPRSSFLLTAQPFFWYQMAPLPGPTFCMTNVAGARPAYTVAFSAGGPIFDAPSCARLPDASGYQPPPPPAQAVTAIPTK